MAKLIFLKRLDHELISHGWTRVNSGPLCYYEKPLSPETRARMSRPKPRHRLWRWIQRIVGKASHG